MNKMIWYYNINIACLCIISLQLAEATGEVQVN